MQESLPIFSMMFIFSALMVAGFVAVATPQKGMRRLLLSVAAFVVSYGLFWLILHYGH